MPSNAEPTISVGLVEQAPGASFALRGTYLLGNRRLPSGRYEARPAGGGMVALSDAAGRLVAEDARLGLIPTAASDLVELRGVIIGQGFHWERSQSQAFPGEFVLDSCGTDAVTIINRLPLEQYLEAVICSEMSPQAPEEFLKAHSIISRSWLLAQLARKRDTALCSAGQECVWTDAGRHCHFDVCADDHCQRYHGIGRVNEAARRALHETRGEVLVFAGAVCDARFSKCCGGITERFATAWEDCELAYLQPVADCDEHGSEYEPPLGSEADARCFISASPKVFCNVADQGLLEILLPDFDVETHNFFRWQVRLTQDELGALLRQKTGIDFGQIRELAPLGRGASGRIHRLSVRGTRQEQVFGKELEIRRILSPSHLYSSAFVIDPYGSCRGVPEGFVLHGAGWGHGVGLCQIGAAAMASQGYDCRAILAHYFRGAQLQVLY
jgi:SpoIID/LytB domain protein